MSNTFKNAISILEHQQINNTVITLDHSGVNGNEL